MDTDPRFQMAYGLYGLGGLFSFVHLNPVRIFHRSPHRPVNSNGRHNHKHLLARAAHADDNKETCHHDYLVSLEVSQFSILHWLFQTISSLYWKILFSYLHTGSHQSACSLTYLEKTLRVHLSTRNHHTCLPYGIAASVAWVCGTVCP